jgi:TonB family protein
MWKILIQISIFWSLSALVYHALLRKETFFASSRMYLILTATAGLVLPFILPMIPTSALPAIPFELNVPELLVNADAGKPSQGPGLMVYLAAGVYFAGLAIALFRIGLGLFRLARLIRSSQTELLPDGCRLIRTDSTQLPYSFFHWIIIPSDYSEADSSGAAILSHERAHAHGWHSVDVLAFELLSAVFWFHPLAHWYRKSLRNVHEYLADNEAARVISKKEYGLLLIQQIQPNFQMALVHHFFQSPMKNRLLMLTRQHGKRSRILKYTLILPLFMCIAWAFLPGPAAHKAKQEGSMPEYPGGIVALMEYLSKNTEYPDAAKAANVTGVAHLEITVDKTGQVSEARVLNQDIDPSLAEEAIRVVESMPRWKPAEVDGKPVVGKLTLPIRFQLE